MKLVAVARIVKPRGVRGEVWVDRFRESFPPFERGSELWLSGEPEGKPLKVQEFFEYSKGCVLKLEGVDRPGEALAFAGREVFLPETDVPEAGPDEFEAGEVAGWALVDANRGPIGTVTGSVPGPAYWIFLAEGPRGEEIEVPAVKGYGVRLDRDKKEIGVELPEGYPGVDDAG